jgi:serine/threonine protein kinase
VCVCVCVFAQTMTGTPLYMAPEIWHNQPYRTAADIWSLGCTIYQMAALKPPFHAARSVAQLLYAAPSDLVCSARDERHSWEG